MRHVPCRVAATVPGARSVADADLIRSEGVAGGAACWRSGDPGARGGLDEVADARHPRHGLTVVRGADGWDDRRMAFKVIPSYPGSNLEFGDKDKFEVTQGGVLKIHRADGTNLYLNHTQWSSVEESPPARPGPQVYAWPGRG